jgi:hypothetical protein
MKMHVRFVGALVVLILGIWLGTSPGRAAKEKEAGWQQILDEASARELIGRGVKSIQEEMSAPKKDANAIRKSNKKIQVAAVMIAAVAESAKDGTGNEMPIYRNAALEVAQAAANGNLDKVKEKVKLMADWVRSGKPENLKPKAPPIALRKYLEDMGDAMQPLRRYALGGDGIHPSLQSTGPLKTLNGIEEKVRVLARRAPKKEQLEKESPELALMAQKIAVIAQLAYEWTSEIKKEGNQDPADWREWSREMRDTALSLAAAAKKKDPKAVFTTAKTLNANCTKCHGIFKKNN